MAARRFRRLGRGFYGGHAARLPQRIGKIRLRSRRRLALRILLLAPVALRKPAELKVLWKQQWKYALAVAVVSPVAYVLVLYAMQHAPMSHVAPAREVSMLFAALIGGHLLKEGDRKARIFGAVLIAAGVTALGLG